MPAASSRTEGQERWGRAPLAAPRCRGGSRGGQVWGWTLVSQQPAQRPRLGSGAAVSWTVFSLSELMGAAVTKLLL